VKNTTKLLRKCAQLETAMLRLRNILEDHRDNVITRERYNEIVDGCRDTSLSFLKARLRSR
jgi:hypothetical protein